MSLPTHKNTTPAGVPKFPIVYYFTDTGTEEPLKEDPNFIGRQDIFQQLDDALFPKTSKPQNQELRVVAMCGMKGIGKTAIAKQYALSRVRGLQGGKGLDAVFFLSANRAALTNGYKVIAEKLNLRVTQKSGPRDAVKRWMENPPRLGSAKASWLLVLHRLVFPEVLLGFLPKPECNGAVLVTTTDPGIHIRMQRLTKAISVGSLSKMEGAAMLKKITKAWIKDIAGNDLVDHDVVSKELQGFINNAKEFEQFFVEASKLLFGLPELIEMLGSEYTRTLKEGVKDFLAIRQLLCEKGDPRTKVCQADIYDSAIGKAYRDLHFCWFQEDMTPESNRLLTLLHQISKERVPEAIFLPSTQFDVWLSNAKEDYLEILCWRERFHEALQPYLKHPELYTRTRDELIRCHFITSDKDRLEISILPAVREVLACVAFKSASDAKKPHKPLEDIGDKELDEIIAEIDGAGWPDTS